ncbi:hypothetical protein CSUI_008974 [Cystoisospora suis]|uniref:Uncharacterized protein n=1 Tax=Cystoisospora suis TaxID=483139 RepID=A0A2C6KL44_9APIC|nr:hypothetical protein CSUI_008974 [Cystoisospora suis]
MFSGFLREKPPVFFHDEFCEALKSSEGGIVVELTRGRTMRRSLDRWIDLDVFEREAFLVLHSSREIKTGTCRMTSGPLHACFVARERLRGRKEGRAVSEWVMSDFVVGRKLTRKEILMKRDDDGKQWSPNHLKE